MVSINDDESGVHVSVSGLSTFRYHSEKSKFAKTILFNSIVGVGAFLLCVLLAGVFVVMVIFS
jgi:hypothetical protein